MSELPHDLFDELLKTHPSTKALAAVALALKNDDPLATDDELCPHCGGVLRSRLRVSREHLKIVLNWLRGKWNLP